MKIQPPTTTENKYMIFALIFILSNKLQAIGDSFFEEVSTKQWFVLVVLKIMNDYAPTLNELSEAVGSSHQNVKQLVLKLEKKGYVELYKDEEDARRLRIRTTPKCEVFSKAYEEKSSIFMDKLFTDFDASDLSAAKKVMSTMKDVLETLEKDYIKEY